MLNPKKFNKSSPISVSQQINEYIIEFLVLISAIQNLELVFTSLVGSLDLIRHM
jgi:hypothetical protein